MKGFTNKKYNTFFDGKVLQICFYSKGCKYNKCGSCIMCDYGKVRKENLKPHDIKKIVNKVCNKFKKLPSILLLNSLGSVLDTEEMPMENIIVLLEELSNINVDVIIFETHYLTINDSILSLIKQKLYNKEVVIELGLESSNKEIREKCLNKYINNIKFIEKINLIKTYGFGVETNVIFGSPFLTDEEQKLDTLNSIQWCFENNIDTVNLFPINIKPYTLLYKLYEQGKYLPVSHKDFINVLNKISKEYIDRIYLCWYGNREIIYDKNKTILPKCNKTEYPILMEFYKKFNMCRNAEKRIELLKNIIE